MSYSRQYIYFSILMIIVLINNLTIFIPEQFQ